MEKEMIRYRNLIELLGYFLVGMLFLICCAAVIFFKTLLWILIGAASIFWCIFIGIVLVIAFTEPRVKK
jgi:hypothetical protein